MNKKIILILALLVVSVFAEDLLLIGYPDGRSRIVPVIEGEGLAIGDDILLRVSTQNITTGFSTEPEADMTAPFGTDDYALITETDWSSPDLVIHTQDGDIAINLIEMSEEGVHSYIPHTRIIRKEVIERQAGDFLTGRLYENIIRPDLSTITLESRLHAIMDGDYVRVMLTEDAIPVKFGNARKTDTGYFADRAGRSLFIEGTKGDAIWGAKVNIGISHEYDGTELTGNSYISYEASESPSDIPVATDDVHEYTINRHIENIKPIDKPFTAFQLRTFTRGTDIPERAREIMELSKTTDDTDGDGLPDYAEIIMCSDPLDAHTEATEYNDREYYLEMGMLPPMPGRAWADPDTLPKPKIYPGDPTPGSYFRLPIQRKPIPAIALKYDNLIKAGQEEEAEALRHRAFKMYIFAQYGEQALYALDDMDHDTPRLHRLHEDWPSYYGTLDTDMDGIPDELEERGWLFGGLGFDDFGTHYWSRLNALASAFPAGWEGVVIGSYIYYDPGLDFNCIQTDHEMFDTDMDGLDDYFEYLWHSCPLLVHSDWTSAAPTDHEKIYEHFLAPRPDWIAEYQDWDDDGLPNGVEHYFMMEVMGAQLDPYTWSTDWDQYSDVEEWKSWWYKDGSFPFPLDDPLPYVVRNGCHPMIPAYPQIVYLHYADKLFMPFNSVFTAARGVSGASETGVEIENKLAAGIELKCGLIPSVKTETEISRKATTSSKVTTAWNMTSTTTYDYSSAQCINRFKIRNMGTEPSDLNGMGDEYFSQSINIYWPGSTTKMYKYNREMGGADDLPPYMDGESDWPDERIVSVSYTLSDLIGHFSEIGTDSPMPSLSGFDGFSYAVTGVNFFLSFFIGGAPGIGYAATKIALTLEIMAGSLLIGTYYEDEMYREFIDDFEKYENMTVAIEREPAYNTGFSGVFSPDNPCDWTSILAAHRNYVTIMCVYPGESDLGNVIKESPLKPEAERSGPEDSLYTLGELIDEYEGLKLEDFQWGPLVDTLVGVGCYPNVWYGDTVVPPYCDDTLTTFGKWVIISSIDTITEPHRIDDFDEHAGTPYLGYNTRLAKGDIFTLYYLQDSDADSLENQLEYVYGTNPYDKDSDNDGLEDNLEIKNGLDPLNPNSDNSWHTATDGEEWLYLQTTEGTRAPVLLQSGDTIMPPRSAWDVYLSGSPRTTSEHRDFVPYAYNMGGYNAADDDQYMDYNTNGVPDWLERYFQNPSERYNGGFKVDWDGPQTPEDPWGYVDNVFEASNVNYYANYDHLCKRIVEPDTPDSNGVLELIFDDISDTDDMWDHSYIYFKVFNCDIDILSSHELSYDLKPLNARAKLITVDLIFSDGYRSLALEDFVDSNGDRVHPAWRPQEGIVLDEWHTVTISLADFAGDNLIGIFFGYEDDPNEITGKVHAYIDNLSIRSKNIVMDFAPETTPLGGFEISNILDVENLRGFDGTGLPECVLRSLPTSRDTIPIPRYLDTLRYGPRDTIWEVSASIDPWTFEPGADFDMKFKFGILPESPDYRIDEKTTLGYYVWQEYAPVHQLDRADLALLSRPCVSVDLLIRDPETGDQVYMLDYLDSIGLEPRDQFDNPLHPLKRSMQDNEGDGNWRTTEGDYWRYIDFQLPEELVGWYIDDVIFRYDEKRLMFGRIRAYFDNISIFERDDEVYYYRDAARKVFGSLLDDMYDDNNDTIVDWENIAIHGLDAVSMYEDYAENTFAGLILKNSIPSFVDDTTLWYWQFALNHSDTSYKYPNDSAFADYSYTLRLDMDTVLVATFDDDGTSFGRLWGYRWNSPGDEVNPWEHSILTYPILDDEDGYLEIRAEGIDSMKLFDVKTAAVCEDQCALFMFDGKMTEGEIWMGYELKLSGEIQWFRACSTYNWLSYRYEAPSEIAGDSITAIWVKSESENALAYLDNVSLRRAFYHSFEDDEDTWADFDWELSSYRNIGFLTNGTLDEPFRPYYPHATHGSHYYAVRLVTTGFNPTHIRAQIFSFFEGAPSEWDMEITGNSQLSYKIFHYGVPTLTRGYALVDLYLVEWGESSGIWLTEVYPTDTEGNYFVTEMRTEPEAEWVNVTVPIPPDFEGWYVKQAAIRWKPPDTVMEEEVDILIDELLISF